MKRSVYRLRSWRHSLMVYLVWIKMIWERHMEYRFNTFANSLGSVFWVGVSLIMYKLVFGKIKTLAGWTFNEMLLLYGVYNLFWGVMVCFFNGGLRITERVRSGDLDKVLLWPGRAFFYTAMKFEPELLVHGLVGVGLFVIALIKIGVDLSLIKVLGFSILLANSFLISFFISMIFGTTAFWFIENTQIVDFFWLWETLAKYPAEFFKRSKILYGTVFTVLPVVFIAVVPTELLLGRLSLKLFLYSFLITFILAILSRKFWRIGLKRYSSVSS